MTRRPDSPLRRISAEEVFVHGFGGAFKAVGMPRKWSAFWSDLDPRVDPNFAISSLTNDQLAKIGERLVGLESASLVIMVSITSAAAFLRMRTCGGSDGSELSDYGLILGLLFMLGGVASIAVSVRAGITMWVVGSMGFVVISFLEHALFTWWSLGGTDLCAQGGILVGGITGGIAVGGGAATTICTSDGASPEDTTGIAVARALVNLAVPLALIAGAALLLVKVAAAPVMEGRGPTSDKHVDEFVRLSAIAATFAISVGSLSFFAIWPRARFGAGDLRWALMKKMWWGFGLLGPVGFWLGSFGDHTFQAGIAYGLLAGAIAGGVFSMSWNLSRGNVGPTAAAVLATVVAAAAPVTLLAARLVAENTAKHSLLLAVSLLVAVPIGFGVVSFFVRQSTTLSPQV
jgi:hypothetical protein